MAVGLSACQKPEDQSELPPVVWEGDHLEFGVSEQAGEYCAGTPAYLDGYVGGLLEILDRPPLDKKVRYSFLAPEEVPDSEKGVLGRSTARGVVSGSPVLEHELVHAVLRPNGLTQPLLEEGLAEFFGGDGYSSFRHDTDRPLEEALAAVDDADLPGEYYGVAGRFVSYIDTTFGRQALLELEDQLGPWSSTTDMETAFATKTAVPFSSAVSEFEALMACPQKIFRDPTAACQVAEPLEWCDGSDAAEHSVALTCNSPDVLGVRDREIWTYRVFTIPRPGSYGLFLSPTIDPVEGYVEIKQCSGGCESFLLHELIPTSLSPATWFDIEDPGDYILKIAVQWPHDEVTVNFQLLGVDCN
ncbi:MAG: hypothetical protein AAGF11_10710 [Myxococcota bacterium]